MRLSTMTYTFSRQPQHFDLDRLLRWTAQHMDGIDFVTLHGRTPKELRARADDLGLPVAAYTFFAGELPSEDPVAFQKALDDGRRNLDAAMVLRAPVVMIPTPGRKDLPREAWRQRWIEGLRRLAPFAADAEIMLTVENFPGADSPFVLADDYIAARDSVPGLKLTFDSGNAGSGEDPAESFTRCAPDVAHAHFKDWNIVDEPREGHRRMLDGRYYRPALIGEGAIDHRACLQAMKRAGYDRYINVEYEGDDYNPFDATQRAADCLRELWAGLERAS